ncbi:MAG: DUF3597 domain-containing protein [Erythrobacter sp.]|nr:MAG: DUF3597 domain-containing protein [Erythrobacter sp.]
MGIFGSIKNAIFGDDEAEEAKAAAPAPAARPATATPPAAKSGFGAASTKAITEVDIEARLDAKEGADKLNWRTSIVDLMKLVGLDPTYENRKELATELGDTDYSGKAEENIWLHKQVMNKLAAAGGRVPADLRD